MPGQVRTKQAWGTASQRKNEFNMDKEAKKQNTIIDIFCSDLLEGIQGEGPRHFIFLRFPRSSQGGEKIVSAKEKGKFEDVEKANQTH